MRFNRQDFDFVHEMNDTTIFGQVKCRSLDDYDFDRPNDDNDWLSVALDRWGDLKVPDRITDRRSEHRNDRRIPA